MPCILVLHFHVLQFHALQIPRKLVRQFHVLHFHALHIGPSISCPAISCLAILMVRHFHVLHFQSTRRNSTRRWQICSDLSKLSPTMLRIPYTPPTRLNWTVESRRRRRCVLGLSLQAQSRTGQRSAGVQRPSS